jgi:type VI secretion system protein VasD
LRGFFMPALIAVALGSLAACGAPPPPPPTIVYVQLTATADANLTADGQGAPVAVRVYQLASKSAFEGAEFYPLYNADAAALGPDLIKKDEVLLAPGSSKTLPLMPADPVHSIGVFAAYRAFQTATWRAATDIPPHQTTTVTVTVGPAGIKLVTTPGKPPGS